MVAVESIKVTPAAGQSRADAWFDYFDQLKLDSEQAAKLHDQRIVMTVNNLNLKAREADKAGKVSEAILHFEEVRDLLAAAIGTGNVRPWMYRAYAISLEATNADPADIERAYLSAVDFADTPEQVLHVAGQLQAAGRHATALRLCREATDASPSCVKGL